MLGRLCEAEVGRECFECFHIIISTNSNNPVFENCDSCKLTPKQSLSFTDKHTEIVLKGFVTSPLSSFASRGCAETFRGSIAIQVSIPGRSSTQQ